MTYHSAKRIFDILLSALGLTATLPFTVPALLAVWLQDFHSPIYRAKRTGRGGKPFTMYKIRSMKVAADKSNVWATAEGDPRITRVGRVIRACKLDEIPQLWNVLKGDMSLVGPRPLAPAETEVFTDVERGILEVQPGVTDIASIVFADEGALLEGSTDPGRDYDQLIRPWKSRLALLYAGKRSLGLDVRLVGLTALAIVRRPAALKMLARTLAKLGADESLIDVAAGRAEISPIPPPGMEKSRKQDEE